MKTFDNNKTKNNPDMNKNHKINHGRYKPLTWASLAVIASVAISSLHAQVLPQKSSEDFNYSYTPTALPNTMPSPNNWILRQGGSGNSANVSSGLLLIQSPTSSYLYYEARPENWRTLMDTAEGFTMEWKIKVGEGKSAGINLAFDEGPTVLGAGYGALKINGDGTQWNQSNNDTYTTYDTSSNSDGFHTFRLVKLGSTATEAGKFNLYRDGALLFENMEGSFSNTEPTNRFFFGNVGAWNSGVEIEYVRWDTNGAFAPVPEPSTVALFMLSALIVTGVDVRRRTLVRMS